MPEFKPPPGVAISLRKPPGATPPDQARLARLREDVAWIEMRQRPPMFQSHYDPYAKPEQEICGSALPAHLLK